MNLEILQNHTKILLEPFYSALNSSNWISRTPLQKKLCSWSKNKGMMDAFIGIEIYICVVALYRYSCYFIKDINVKNEIYFVSIFVIQMSRFDGDKGSNEQTFCEISHEILRRRRDLTFCL